MFEFLRALTQLGWKDWATIVGVLFGVVSMIAYFDQRRSAKQNADISEFLRRHVSKDISEETIERLNAQRRAMEDQVNNNIPKLARRAVLREQEKVHADAVAKHFTEWQKLQEELKSDAADGGVDPAIEKIIVDRLLPQYERATQVDQLRTRTTILSVAVAIAGVALPGVLSWFVSFVLAVPLVATLAQLARETSDPKDFWLTARGIATGLIGVAGVLAIGTGAAFLRLSPESLTQTGRVVGWFLAIAGSTLVGVAIVMHFTYRRRTRDAA